MVEDGWILGGLCVKVSAAYVSPYPVIHESVCGVGVSTNRGAFQDLEGRNPKHGRIKVLC